MQTLHLNKLSVKSLFDLVWNKTPVIVQHSYSSRPWWASTAETRRQVSTDVTIQQPGEINSSLFSASGCFYDSEQDKTR